MSDHKMPVFFSAETIGKSLQEVQVDFIKTEADNIVSRWFHAEKDADLYLWIDSKSNVIKHQVSFYGQIVEWNIIDGIKTGVIIEEETDKFGTASELIHYDEKPQQASIGLALDLVNNVPGLEIETKQLIADNFKNGNSLQTMGDKKFIKMYAHKLAIQVVKEGYWTRLKRFFKP